MGLTVNSDNTGEFLDGMGSAIERALEEMGLRGEAIAKENLETPKPHADGRTRPNVVTGNLVNRVTHAVDSGERAVYIGTNVEYAPYVEMGTSRSAPYPFLRPAAANHGDEYRAILEKHLKGQ